ncbi:MAG: hypothetical protein KY395_06390 [Actinobacteria bacterium]|nr:hypothetical protein [Actinomycetota bacterium]
MSFETLPNPGRRRLRSPTVGDAPYWTIGVTRPGRQREDLPPPGAKIGHFGASLPLAQ